MARVLLIRHCQTTGQSFDSPLTDLGRKQAVTLAAWLQGRGVDRIVSSPYQRAVDTILPFAKDAGLEVEVDHRLAERDLGGGWYETVAELHEAVRAAMDDSQLRHPGGETGFEVVARGWPALAEALNGSNTLTVLVGHGQMNSHLLREIEPGFGFDAWRAMTTPDVFEVWQDDGRGLQMRRLWQERT